jgi:hypothetical protein
LEVPALELVLIKVDEDVQLGTILVKAEFLSMQ